jgi:small nuclear ribonucleoprotein (snRNP)-like protein
MDRNDGRALVGQMLAYDKHMNFVLAECEEFRTVKVGFYLVFKVDADDKRERRQKTPTQQMPLLQFNKSVL